MHRPTLGAGDWRLAIGMGKLAVAGEGEGEAAFRADLVEAEAGQLSVAERGRTRRMLAWGWRLEVGGWRLEVEVE